MTFESQSDQGLFEITTAEDYYRELVIPAFDQYCLRIDNIWIGISTVILCHHLFEKHTGKTLPENFEKFAGKLREFETLDALCRVANDAKHPKLRLVTKKTGDYLSDYSDDYRKPLSILVEGQFRSLHGLLSEAVEYWRGILFDRSQS